MKNSTPIKIISLLLLLSVNGLQAQTINLQKRFGTNTMDRVYKSISTIDSGFLLIGAVYKNDNGFGDDDILIIKLNKFLTQEWLGIYGGEDNDAPFDIIEDDNGYFIVGSTQSSILKSSIDMDNDFRIASKGGLDCLMFRIGNDGKLEGVTTFGGSKTDYASRVLKLPDNKYLIGAVSDSDISGDKGHRSRGTFDYWIYRLKSDLTIDWQKTIGGNNDDRLDVLAFSAEGNILAGGTSRSRDGGDKTVGRIGIKDIWLMELDSIGTIIWQNVYGTRFNDIYGEYYESNVSRALVQDGEKFYMVGSAQNRLCGSKQYDYSIYQVNNSGMLRKTIKPYANKDDAASSFLKCEDGGWLIAGVTRSDKGGDKSEESRGGHDIWVIKLDKDFRKMWDKTFGGNLDEFGPNLIKVSKNEYLIPLTSSSTATGDINVGRLGPSSDILIIKIKDQTIPD